MSPRKTPTRCAPAGISEPFRLDGSWPPGGGRAPRGRTVRAPMQPRTITTHVTFKAPFRLSSLEGEQPAGTYRIETDEEQIDGLSFNAFQRLSTTLYLPADPQPGTTPPAGKGDP